MLPRTASAAPAQAPPAAAPAAADTTPAQRGQVRGLATWDENYLYFAFRIDDPNVLGTNTAPLSKPEEDDSVGVYLQIGSDRPTAPNASTYAMLVSAAGGFTFLQGDPEQKVLKVKPLFSIKYAVSLQGTLNREDDRDQGYTVEMAIPWAGVGVDPKTLKPGTEIGVNIVVRDREAKTLASLSENVRADADINDPSKWTRVTLLAPGALPDPSAGGVPAPQVEPRDGQEAVPPLIDGVLRVANEWPAGGRFPFVGPARPERTGAAPVVTRPTVVADEEAPQLHLNKQALTGMERLLFARYLLSYQGDLRKPSPFRGILDAKTGQFQLADHPPAGVGPWFSVDRPAWHRAQLTDMKRSGIDVALVELGGPDGDASLLDEKALMVLVSALREMVVEGVPAPLLVPSFDTTRLAPPGTKPNLATDEGHANLYRAVRRWFAMVPPEFRARVQLPPAAGGVPAYPIFLSDGAALTEVGDKDWADNLRQRFAKEFGAGAGGTTLLIAGGPGFDAAPGVLASAPLLTGGAGSGPLPTFVIRPGVDTNGTLVPRRGGDAFVESWEASFAAQPVWTIIDSWNDFTRGTEIAASREYGTRYQDLTRIFAIQAGDLPPRDARWLGHDAPRRMRPGQIVRTTLTLQNGGKLPISEDQGVVLTYRWRDAQGRVVSEAPLPLRFTDMLLPTQTRKVTVGLAALAVGQNGSLDPLPPGDYTAEVDLAILANPAEPFGKRTFFSESGDAPLRLPIQITPDAPGGIEIQATTTPTMMQTGGTYPVILQARWMGSETIAPDQANLTWQLISTDGQSTIATGSALLPEPLTPGGPITLRAILNLADAGGAPLPPSFPELTPGLGTPGGGYRLRWLLTRTQSTEAIAGGYEERVGVYGGDEEARVTLPERLPEKADADALIQVKVNIVNRGAAKWTKGSYAVGYHWYHGDGIEATWKPAMMTTIDRDVAPGESMTTTVTVRTPAHDGAYVLGFDVAKKPEEFFSVRPVTRTGDMALGYLRVVGGRLTFVDLAKVFDTDAVASEAKPEDGDMNGHGATFPAEFFPPDVYGLNAVGNPERLPAEPGDKKPRFKQPQAPAYPSGYYTEISPSARRISFRYGPDADGQKNAITCRGQVVNVPRGSYTGLHIAAAAIGGEDRQVKVTLTYKDKTTEQVTLNVGDWSRAPTPSSEATALLAHRKRTPKGDLAGISAVRHIVCRVNIQKELVSVTLPDDTNVRVFAMTLDH